MVVWQRTVVVGVACGALIAGAAFAGPDPSSSWRAVLRDGAAIPPWSRRIPPTPLRPWAGLTSIESWPDEPVAPAIVEAERLGYALAQLCGKLRPARARQYAGWILEGARLRGIDPFLLGGLLSTSSRCQADYHDPLGLGLAGIRINMHARLLHQGRLRYWTLDETGWQPREMLVDAFPFTTGALVGAQANLYFAAALLRLDELQCAALDRTVRSEPHRHFVSHFFWGDRVLGTRFEETVLQERRRLLRLYEERPPEALAEFRGVHLCSPLDGVPRQLSSRFREPRPNGRRHGGVDFASTRGEAVRAVADGVVIFAGIGHRGGSGSNLTPRQAGRASRRSMGIGGLFVLIDHGGRLTSGYFHLGGYTVRRGEPVRANQIIGAVGDTGTTDSPAHLHFELRVRGRNVDPARRLRPYVVPSERPRTAARWSPEADRRRTVKVTSVNRD